MHSTVSFPAASVLTRVYLPPRPLDPEFDEPFFFRARAATQPATT
jgi:hypothetical protein